MPSDALSCLDVIYLMINNDAELEESINGGGLGAMIQQLAKHPLLIIDGSLSNGNGQVVVMTIIVFLSERRA